MTGDETRSLILDFIARFVREHGFSPSVDECRKAAGLKSKSTVHAHLRTLQREGRLSQVPGSPRTLRVVESGEK